VDYETRNDLSKETGQAYHNSELGRIQSQPISTLAHTDARVRW
jgi:hypothetical protein